MVKPELGTKRACPSCHGRFYDLNRDPIVCPLCGTSFFAEALLPSKADHPAPAQPKPQPAAAQPRADDEEVELVSLEDVKEDGDDADDIEDVEIEGDDAADDAFLEEEEEGEEGVSGLIGGKEDEEET